MAPRTRGGSSTRQGARRPGWSSAETRTPARARYEVLETARTRRRHPRQTRRPYAQANLRCGEANPSSGGSVPGSVGSSKMAVPTRHWTVALLVVGAATQHNGAFGRAHTDPGERYAGMPCDLCQTPPCAGPDRQQQLVVVAAGNGPHRYVARPSAEPVAGCRFNWERVVVDNRPDAARLGQPVDGIGEAIAQVHAGAGSTVPGDELAEPHAGLRIQVTRRARPLAGSTRLSEHLEAGRCGANRPRHVELVTRRRAAPPGDLTPLDCARHGDVDHEWARRSSEIAAGDMHPVSRGERQQAVEHGFEVGNRPATG